MTLPGSPAIWCPLQIRAHSNSFHDSRPVATWCGAKCGALPPTSHVLSLRQDSKKKTNKQLCWKNIPGWWLTYPSEKYESQLGLLFPIYGKIKFMFQTTNQIQTCRILFIDPPWFLKMSICLVVFPCFSQLTCLKGGLGISDDGHVPSRFPKWIYPVARAVGGSYGTLGTKPRRHPHSSSTIW